PAGSLVITGASRDVAQQLAQRFGLDVVATSRPPNVPRHAADVPRVAVYHTWYNTQDEGWARFTLEQYGVPYTSIDKDDLRAGNLRSRFDAILIPQVRGEVNQIVQGIDRKWGPMPVTKTPEFPSPSTPASSADVTGGMGLPRLGNRRRCGESAGMLLTLGSPTRLVTEAGRAPRLSRRAARTLSRPGSGVTAPAPRRGHPLMHRAP